MKQLSKLSLAVALAVLGLSSCQKEQIVDKPGKTTPTDKLQKTSSVAEHAKYLTTGTLSALGVNGFVNRVPDFFNDVCATVTVDSSSSPFVATLDFGTGCISPTGEYNSGVLIIRYPNSNADFSDPNTELDVQFINHVWDSVEINGTLDFDNLGYNGLGNMYGTYVLSCNLEEVATGEQYTSVYNQNFEVKGSFVEISGGLTVNDTHGNTISQSVIDPLWRETQSGCNGVYTKGIVHITETGQPDYYVDYGSGGCDLIAHEVRGGVRTPISAGSEE